MRACGCAACGCVSVWGRGGGGGVSGGAHEFDAELDGEEGDAYHLDPRPRFLGDVRQQLRHCLKHHRHCRHEDDHHDLPRGGRQWVAAAVVAVAVAVAVAVVWPRTARLLAGSQVCVFVCV